jgi:uncharacterized protein
MKRLSSLLVLFLLSATACTAQQAATDQPATKQDIERYLEVTHVRELMKTVMDAASKQTRQIVHEQLQKTPNLPPDFEEQMNKLSEGMLKNFPTEELLEAMVPVYQKHFTKGDIEAFVAFYSGPTGQKLLREMPAITQESMQASLGVMRKFMDQVMRQVQEQVAQAQKKNSSKN